MKFILRNIWQGVWVIWGIVTILFVIFFVIGDPVQYLVDEKASEEETIALRKKYKLDRPILIQYVSYLNDLSPLGLIEAEKKEELAHLSLIPLGENSLGLKAPYLGRSYKYGIPVAEMLGSRIKGTLILAMAAIIFAAILGISLGLLASLQRDSWLDRSILSFSVLGISAPSFFIGVLIAWVFGVLLRDWTGLNVSGYIFKENVFSEGQHMELKNLILPALALGIRPLAVFIQLTRSSMIEVLNSNYIRTARAKGLSPFPVLVKHALRNALNPVMTSITGWLASLLAGAFFIEYIFNWQGIGKLIIDSLANRDLPLIMAGVLMIGIVFVIVSIITDLLYRQLDPRVKLT
ncbi:MAG: ABC transporter permease [Bacteroidota bacterium]